MNLLGQLHAIDDAGRFRLLTVGEILDGEVQEEARALARARRSKWVAPCMPMPPDDEFESIFETILASCREHLDHVPSSLQWIEQQLRAGTLQPRLTPTETWLLEPLIRYAHAAGLEDAAHYFEALTRRLEHRLAVAIAGRTAP